APERAWHFHRPAFRARADWRKRGEAHPPGPGRRRIEEAFPPRDRRFLTGLPAAVDRAQNLTPAASCNRQFVRYPNDLAFGFSGVQSFTRRRKMVYKAALSLRAPRGPAPM